MKAPIVISLFDKMETQNEWACPPNIIASPVAESIRNTVQLIIKEASYMENTGEEFTDSEKYNALVRILNASESYFRKNLHI